ncbi:penicillin-binding transpeptidase domain-containing protein [Bacteriovoracaceae bacterium]|nr:penicillin-binding transpeptidase domain-containing protein [Bacteriovoracaceae bacterium]
MAVIDNNSGAIISAVDFTRSNQKFGNSMVFSNTHPAASVFKVITAAALFENTSKSPDSQYAFRGRSSTLYKNQLNSKKNNRKIKFSKAFARSNNVVFGKVAMKELGAGPIFDMAKKFKFGSQFIDDLNIGHSVVQKPDNAFEIAELGSGFNRETRISPIHGALIASIVSNNGTYYKPYIIDSIYNKYFNKQVYRGTKYKRRVLSFKTSSYLNDVMSKTLTIGTGRKTFRRFKLLDFLEIGGKTGSITGGEPYGKRDWFIAYAKPKFSSEGGISICVMIVNKKKWYVKSTLLAKKIIQYYYTGLD